MPGLAGSHLVVYDAGWRRNIGSSTVIVPRNQLDLNITKTIKFGRTSIQPKFDLFNALNVAPVYGVRSLNFGTASYNQPSSCSRCRSGSSCRA